VIGAAYGLPAIVDDVLAGQPDVYLEAGDHLDLLHLRGDQFARLMQDVQHGRFSS
jgi:Ala-tRNA(Pro) deacylase